MSLRTVKIAIEAVQSAKNAATFAGILKGFDLITDAVESTVSVAKELTVQSIKLASNFEKTTNAFAVFAGSAGLAKRELESIAEAVRNTNGLRLEGAEKSAAQLRGLGFQAETTRKLIVGLGKEKLLSPLADETAIQRVIVNLTQLSAGSNRAAQDIKEIFHSLPSLRGAFADAFGTLDTKKIKEVFESNPDKAIEKLAEAMAKVQTPAGGLDNALGKLSDAGIELGRTFGLPILEPLTSDVTDLTSILQESKPIIAEWGQTFADALRGISDAGRGLSQLDSILGLTPNQAKALKEFTDKANPIARRVGLGAATFGYSELFNGITSLGEDQRLAEEARKRKKAQIVGFDNLNIDKTKLSTFIDPATNTVRFESESEKLARLGKDNTSQIAGQQKELLANLKSLRSEQLAISESYYKTEEARLTSHLDYTTAQELETSKSVFASRQNSIDSQISLTKKYYSDLFKFGDLDKAEELKATRERNTELAKLGGERISEEYKQQKQIAEFEKKINDEKRQSLIEYKNLQIEQIKFASENNVFDVSKFIDAGITSANEGYERLKQLTQNAYQDISKLTLESFQMQLQNLTLTKEQRFNLTTEMYLSEQKLASENARKIAQIEDDKFQKSFENFKQQNEQIIKLSQQRGQIFGQLQNTFFQNSVSFGDGFNSKGSQFGLGVLDTEREISLVQKLGGVLKGNLKIYDVQKDLLEKSQKSENANLQRQIDLNRDLINLERARLKGQLSSNLSTLASNRQSVLQQQGAGILILQMRLEKKPRNFLSRQLEFKPI